MEELNIPLYRAKKIDSDRYVVGYLAERTMYKQFRIMKDLDSRCNHDIIDTDTLAIHFPNMLDSKNNRIFASLREDGKGGSLTDEHEIFIFNNLTNSVIVCDIDFIGKRDMYEGVYNNYYKSFTTEGIQK